MKPINAYLVGTGSWFMAFGMQSVMFTWLVTMVLRESPTMVGVAQMTLLLPGTLLILLGGGISDRFGGLRVVMLAQSISVVAPILLIYLIWTDNLTFQTMLIYAVLMGCATAFVTPARDGLLNHVASGRIQHAVMLTSMTQFGFQILGFVFASFTDAAGPLVILLGQASILVIGVVGFSRIPPQTADTHSHRHLSMIKLVREGAVTVWGDRQMRTVLFQNVAMGMFFMGSYIVTMPLLVREVFEGSAADLAWMNAANSLGLVCTTMLILRLGGIHRQGRALILAQGIGALVLATGGVVPNFALFVAMLFVWGACGGIAMTMARTIVQEQAP
ncbi:MAG: MFS transporter, partial [Proteobacteria bacterium]|nr:MFS transporter [Pseudomonadota bacterium]